MVEERVEVASPVDDLIEGSGEGGISTDPATPLLIWCWRDTYADVVWNSVALS